MYNVGDMVISVKPVGNKKVIGAVGIIVYVSYGDYLVDFNEDIGGHTGTSHDSKCKPGCGWWLGETSIEPYADIDPWAALYQEDPAAPKNDYSKACFHCRPGGIVDRLAFASGLILLCPSCGRVCDGRGAAV